MQTFLPYVNCKKSAKSLDIKRLGKQRVEALQIADILVHGNLSKSYKWRNHPACLIWLEYAPFLLFRYIPAIFEEWGKRGYSNELCQIKYNELKKDYLFGSFGTYSDCCSDNMICKPKWLTKKFCYAHQSNLIRKDEHYYRPIFGNSVPSGLPYIWPVKKA